MKRFRTAFAHKKVPLLKTQILGRFDKPLLLVVLGLLIFGVVMVANASVVDATRFFDDKFYFAKRQLFWAIVGIISLFVCLKLDYRIWKKLSLPILIGTLVLLVAVLIPGVGTKVLGAKRWINLGSFSLQPAELAKFALITYFSRVFSDKIAIPPFLFPLGLVIGLVMLEPDMGTTMVISAVSIIMYFAGGAPVWHFLALIPAGLVGFLFILASDYRRERLLTFLNPAADPLGASYHIRQILIALGSGGIFGLGLGQSRQKYLFLPEPATDSIFAIIGEELGFIGALAVILAFAFIVWRGFNIAAQVSDPFGRLLAIGITSWIGVQAFVNLSAMVAIVPLTGVPLPFLSYGGTALILNLSAMGILLSISKNRDLKK